MRKLAFCPCINKGAVTAQLISTFVFAYVDCLFSDEVFLCGGSVYLQNLLNDIHNLLACFSSLRVGMLVFASFIGKRPEYFISYFNALEIKCVNHLKVNNSIFHTTCFSPSQVLLELECSVLPRSWMRH